MTSITHSHSALVSPVQFPRQQPSAAVQDNYFTKAKTAISSAKDKVCSATHDVLQDIFTEGHVALVGSSLFAFFMGAVSVNKDDDPKPFLLAGSLLFGGALLQVGVKKVRQKKYKKAAAFTLLGGAMAAASTYLIYSKLHPSRADEIQAMIQRRKENRTPCQILGLFPAAGSPLRKAYEKSSFLSQTGALAGACAHMNQTEVSTFIQNLKQELHLDAEKSKEIKDLAQEALAAIEHAQECIKIKTNELNLFAGSSKAKEDPSTLHGHQVLTSKAKPVCRWV